MINKIYLFFLFLTPISLSAGILDTVSIKGIVHFDHKTPALNGEFVYTIHNNSQSAQQTWSVVVHPDVQILSLTQQNTEASFTVKPGGNYKLLVIKLPHKLESDKRTKITIKTTLLTQNKDARFMLTEKFVFLDARKIWFPFPDDDLEANLALDISTSSDFYSITGSALVKENTNLPGIRTSSWKNELSYLGLSSTLIITDKPRHQIDNIYVYTENSDLIQIVNREFLPFWNTIRQKQYRFPLSQLHIMPTDLTIPGKPDEFADGEFLGNLIFIDNKLSSLAVKEPKTNFYFSGPADKRFIETLIHETYHSYFPGMLRYDPTDALFIESLVQYMAWYAIKELDPLWAKNIQERHRFLLQNLAIRNSENYLWDFLFNTSILIASFENSSFSSFELADTLVEKYRYITFNKQDFIETASLHRSSEESQGLNKINLDLLKLTNRKELFNSSLNVIATNFIITITNKNGDRKKKVLTIPVEMTVLKIEHNYPKEWQGKLTWIKNDKTNTISLLIPNDSIWITNLPGNISQAFIQSHLDPMELYLADNILDPSFDPGYQLINLLNKSKNLDKHPKIEFTESTLKEIKNLKEKKFLFLWDNTINTGKSIIETFILDTQKNKKGYIQIIFNKENDNFKIFEIIDPLKILKINEPE